eukprot:3046153-Rhodomonas_salina.1
MLLRTRRRITSLNLERHRRYGAKSNARTRDLRTVCTRTAVACGLISQRTSPLMRQCWLVWRQCCYLRRSDGGGAAIHVIAASIYGGDASISGGGASIYGSIADRGGGHRRGRHWRG